MPPCVGASLSPLLFAQHAEESQQRGTGQNNVRAWKEGTHLLEGADLGLAKVWKCHQVLVCLGAPSSPLLFVVRHAEESQQGGTGQNNIREWKEGMHLLEGADPGTGQDMEGHSMAVNLGQRKRAQTWLLRKLNMTHDQHCDLFNFTHFFSVSVS